MLLYYLSVLRIIARPDYWARKASDESDNYKTASLVVA